MKTKSGEPLLRMKAQEIDKMKPLMRAAAYHKIDRLEGPQKMLKSLMIKRSEALVSGRAHLAQSVS